MTTWNHQTWDVDGVAGPLLKKAVAGFYRRGNLEYTFAAPRWVFFRNDGAEKDDGARKDTVIAQLRRLNLWPISNQHRSTACFW